MPQLSCCCYYVNEHNVDYSCQWQSGAERKRFLFLMHHLINRYTGISWNFDAPMNNSLIISIFFPGKVAISYKNINIQIHFCPKLKCIPINQTWNSLVQICHVIDKGFIDRVHSNTSDIDVTIPNIYFILF
jgi:hypothetical protein